MENLFIQTRKRKTDPNFLILQETETWRYTILQMMLTYVITREIRISLEPFLHWTSNKRKGFQFLTEKPLAKNSKCQTICGNKILIGQHTSSGTRTLAIG